MYTLRDGNFCPCVAAKRPPDFVLHSCPTGQAAWSQLANEMLLFVGSGLLEHKQRQPHAQRQLVRHHDFPKPAPILA